MRFLAVLNKDGGTLRTIDLVSFEEDLVQRLEAAGHTVEVEIVGGDGVVDALSTASRRRNIDVVMAGGGDGTISAAAAALAKNKKALAILPCGTMNLFARGLAIPLGLTAAIDAFAEGKIRQVDLASANDQIFVHQFSVGMHPQLVRLRERMAYGSRWGKMRASMRAAFITLKRPARLRARLELQDTEIQVTASSIGISNNLFGEGHLPYADMPDKGVLGIYIAKSRQLREIVRFAAHMAAGRWRTNPEVEVHTSDKVVLHVKPGRRKLTCSVDGELMPLAAKTTISILPGALNVLVPKDA